MRAFVASSSLVVLLIPLASSAQQLVVPVRWRMSAPIELAAGDGDAALGVTPAGEEEPARGPRAIVASSRGLVVLDNQNHRVVAVPPEARPRFSHSLPIEDAKGVDQLLDSGDEVVAIDGARGRLSYLDLVRGTSRSSTLAAGRIGSVHVRPDGRWTTTDADGRAHTLEPGALTGVTRRPRLGDVTGLPAVPRVSFAQRGGRFEASFRPRAGGAPRRIPMAVAGRLLSASIVGTDGQRRSYVRTEVSADDDTLRVRRFIHVLDSAGGQVDVLEYPTAGVIVPDQDVTVDGRGEISILLPRPDGTQIWRFSPP